MADKAIKRAELPQRADLTRPGEGYRDTVAESIGGVRRAIGQAPADAYRQRMLRAVTDACDALDACRNLLRDLADDYTAQSRAMTEIIRDAKAAARAIVPTFGHADPMAYQGAARDAEARAEGAITTSIKNKVLADYGDRSTKVGTRAFTMLQALSDAIDSVYADATSPTGLREGSDSSLARITKLSAIERGLRAHPTPAKEIQRLFTGFLSRGEDEKILDLVDATGVIVAEIRSSASKVRGGPRYSGGVPFDAGAEVEIAHSLARAFADWAKTQVPKSIKIANDCFEDLKDIFRVVCGADARLLNRAEFAMRYLSGASAGADAGAPYRLENNWTSRAFSPAYVESSGWSQKVFSESGAIIRAPKGR